MLAATRGEGRLLSASRSPRTAIADGEDRAAGVVERGAVPARSLGPWAAGSMVVGSVIGVGVFLTPVEMAQGLGASGWVFAMWLVTGVMAIAGALCFAELAARMPEAGGPYVYLREAYGPRVAFLYGWHCLLVMDPGVSAALASGASSYAAYLMPLSALGAKLFAIGTIITLAGLSAAGTRLAAGLLVVVTAIKVAALVAIVVWGFASGAAQVARLEPLFERSSTSPALAAGLAGGFVAAFFSFGGWWEATKMAGEVRRPSRNLPLALVGGVAVVTALYLLASAVFLSLLPASAAGGEVSAPMLGERLFGAAGGRVLAIAVLFSVLGSLAAMLQMTPRIYVALAGNGLLPRALGSVHPMLGTPARAIALEATLASLLVAVGSFDQIVSFFVFVTVVFVTASAIALFVLPTPAPGSFRPPLRRLAATVFVVLSCVLLVLMAVGRPVPVLAASAIVALGLPAYTLFSRGGGASTAPG